MSTMKNNFAGEYTTPMINVLGMETLQPVMSLSPENGYMTEENDNW